MDKIIHHISGRSPAIEQHNYAPGGVREIHFYTSFEGQDGKYVKYIPLIDTYRVATWRITYKKIKKINLMQRLYKFLFHG